jgi:hypothetical protein
VDHVNISFAPPGAAFFDGPAVARAGGKLHRAQIIALDEIAPVCAVSRHLVHVGKVVAQIAVARFYKASPVLMTNRADICRVEGHDIGFYFELADRGDDEIMGNPAIRYLDRGVALRQPNCRGIKRGTRLATTCIAGSYSGGSARNVRPLLFLDARVA